MSNHLQEQVVHQAQLLIRLLATIGDDGRSRHELDEATADVAELMFEGFEQLHEAARQLESASATEAVVLANSSTQGPTYRDLVERIRERVTSELPVGSTVAVVSRGDGSLLRLPGLQAWHFPQNDMGVWAGYHPANGPDAVDHLVDVWRKGARYLLIPATSSWWLDFYVELREHLAKNGRLVVSDEDLVLYEIDPEATSRATPEAARYYGQVRQFLELTDALLPAGSTVLVVNRGDDALLATQRAKACDFPADESGAYAGSPFDSDAASAALRASMDRGADYFAVPAPLRWWEDAYPAFFARLRLHRCIADQAEAGVVYELNPLN